MRYFRYLQQSLHEDSTLMFEQGLLEGQVGFKVVISFDQWLKKLINCSCRAIYMIMLPRPIVNLDCYTEHHFGHS